MYFAIGAHPGFNLPLDQQTTFTDYYLEFSPKQPRKFIPVTEEVLLQTDKAVELADSSYPINRELFSQGVLIWETAGNTRIELKSDKTEKAVVFDYSNMPYLGIWSPYPQEAPFVCIEPWCGIADTFDTKLFFNPFQNTASSDCSALQQPVFRSDMVAQNQAFVGTILVRTDAHPACLTTLLLRFSISDHTDTKRSASRIQTASNHRNSRWQATLLRGFLGDSTNDFMAGSDFWQDILA